MAANRLRSRYNARMAEGERRATSGQVLYFLELEQLAVGYQTILHLIDVKIKSESVSIVERVLSTRKGRGVRPILEFLSLVAVDCDGFLAFRPSNDYDSPYTPYEEDETVPAVCGKWHEADRIAKWLRHHCQRGGRLIQHSSEGDGLAWGWTFDGRGRMKYMELRPIGKWE